MPLDPRQTYSRDAKPADFQLSALEREERLQPLLDVLAIPEGSATLAASLASFPTQKVPVAVAAVNLLAHDDAGPRCGRELLRKDEAIARALVDAILRTPVDDVSYWTAQDAEPHIDRMASVYAMLSTLGMLFADEPRCAANEVTFGRSDALCTFLSGARKLWSRTSAGAGSVARFMERLSRYARIARRTVPAKTLPSFIDLALAVYAATKLQAADPFSLGRAVSAVGIGELAFSVVGARVQALGFGRVIGESIVLQLKQSGDSVGSCEATRPLFALLPWFIGDGPDAAVVERSFLLAGVPSANAPLLCQAPPDDCSERTTKFWEMIAALASWKMPQSDFELLIEHGYVEMLAKATTFATHRDFTRADPPRSGRASVRVRSH